MAANTFNILATNALNSLNTVKPQLIWAALLGAGFGIGLEGIRPNKGAFIPISTVTGVALSALNYYCGYGALIGTGIGFFASLNPKNKLREIFGAMVVGGILGHLATPLLNRMIFVL